MKVQKDLKHKLIIYVKDSDKRKLYNKMIELGLGGRGNWNRFFEMLARETFVIIKGDAKLIFNPIQTGK